MIDQATTVKLICLEIHRHQSFPHNACMYKYHLSQNILSVYSIREQGIHTKLLLKINISEGFPGWFAICHYTHWTTFTLCHMVYDTCADAIKTVNSVFSALFSKITNEEEYKCTQTILFLN